MMNREYFKTNKENMENQVRNLLMTSDKDIKVTKVLWDNKNNIGLLRWNARTITGLRVVYVIEGKVLVRNLSEYHRTTIEACHIIDDLYMSMRHRNKPDYIAEYRFR